MNTLQLNSKDLMEESDRLSARRPTKRFWTAKEESRFRGLRDAGLPDRKIAKELDRTLTCVQNKARRLDLPDSHFRHTREQIDIVKKYAGKIPARELARKSRMTYSALHDLAYRLELSLRFTKRLWTPKEYEIIRQFGGKKPIRKIAHKLGRTEQATKDSAMKLRISLAYERKNWTSEDDSQLKALYNVKKPLWEISQKMGRSYGSCQSRIARLGIMRHLN